VGGAGSGQRKKNSVEVMEPSSKFRKKGCSRTRGTTNSAHTRDVQNIKERGKKPPQGFRQGMCKTGGGGGDGTSGGGGYSEPRQSKQVSRGRMKAKTATKTPESRGRCQEKEKLKVYFGPGWSNLGWVAPQYASGRQPKKAYTLRSLFENIAGRGGVWVGL